MLCLNCGNEFEAKRLSSKYCSTSCRVAFNRRVSVTDKPKDVTVSVSVTGRFEDLPLDVQKSIEYMSNREGVEYEAEKALRTQRAWDRFGQPLVRPVRVVKMPEAIQLGVGGSNAGEVLEVEAKETL